MKIHFTVLIATILFTGCSDEWSMDETSDFYVKCTEVMESSYDNTSEACACVRDKYIAEGKTFEQAFETAFASLDNLKKEVEACGATPRK
ncbi:MAG: hypothetical protein AB7H80_02055 [Candidatus Kapaibacterium sp.]